MKLLVSVARADEVTAAVTAGADIVDAKEPSVGALGAVHPDELAAITRQLADERPLSVALGDATDEHAVIAAVRGAAAARAGFVKLGFAGIVDAGSARPLAQVAVDAARESGGTQAILVAYADSPRAPSLSPRQVLEVAASVGADGVLLDTCRKDGGSLFTLMRADDVARWVDEAHAAGLTAALAGSLDLAAITMAADAGADIAGVRGAACVGGREGRISEERVAALVAACGKRGPV